MSFGRLAQFDCGIVENFPRGNIQNLGPKKPANPLGDFSISESSLKKAVSEFLRICHIWKVFGMHMNTVIICITWRIHD